MWEAGQMSWNLKDSEGKIVVEGDFSNEVNNSSIETIFTPNPAFPNSQHYKRIFKFN